MSVTLKAPPRPSRKIASKKRQKPKTVRTIVKRKPKQHPLGLDVPEDVMECWEMLTDRQRRFCFNYAQGMTCTQAYIDAGFSAANASGSAGRMLGTNNKVKHVLAYLRNLYAMHLNLGLAEELAIVAEIARDPKEDSTVRLAAVKLSAQIQGHIERSVAGRPTTNVLVTSANPMAAQSDEEFLKQYASVQRELEDVEAKLKSARTVHSQNPVEIVDAELA